MPCHPHPDISSPHLQPSPTATPRPSGGGLRGLRRYNLRLERRDPTTLDARTRTRLPLPYPATALAHLRGRLRRGPGYYSTMPLHYYTTILLYYYNNFYRFYFLLHYDTTILLNYCATMLLCDYETMRLCDYATLRMCRFVCLFLWVDVPPHHLTHRYLPHPAHILQLAPVRIKTLLLLFDSCLSWETTTRSPSPFGFPEPFFVWLFSLATTTRTPSLSGIIIQPFSLFVCSVGRRRPARARGDPARVHPPELRLRRLGAAAELAFHPPHAQVRDCVK